MRLAYIDICGFRGYRKRLRVDFGIDFTIIDGRNGVGKSTIFDAVEFALTGDLSKYAGAKADGESVADYIWWTGNAEPPENRYVEVGFSDVGRSICVRRTQVESPSSDSLNNLADNLCDLSISPNDPLGQLCSRAIIRDEQIAGLSLDLKEVERYSLLRDGLGASNADVWIARGASLVALAKKRSIAAQEEVSRVNSEVALTNRRADEVRSRLLTDSVLAEAAQRLRDFSKSSVSPDQLTAPARARIAEISLEIESLENIVLSWPAFEKEKGRLPLLRESAEKAVREVEAAENHLTEMRLSSNTVVSTELATRARDLIMLVDIGRRIDIQSGHCPLCASALSPAAFTQGLATAEKLAKELDEQAAKEAKRENLQKEAEQKLVAAKDSLRAIEIDLKSSELATLHFNSLRERAGLSDQDTPQQVGPQIEKLRAEVQIAEKDLRVLDTIRISADFSRIQREGVHATQRLASCQERAGRARKAETLAQALYDAARRAASETLDRRLDRVLPLMSELYRRLRPHPVWWDIEYSIRGDVRKFLKLQVGDDLNPQFLFSSGQRRATGLAFLLSVNLSLAWSRFKTIMMDDPVQHVDDFRTVHLAELTGHLVADGRQIICAVEDAALADLLCRRLPVSEYGSAKRVTLGPDVDGDPSITDDRLLAPMANASLFEMDMASTG